MTRVQHSLSDLAAGRPVVLVPGSTGDPDGYLLLAAETASSASVAFLVQHSSGFVCAAVTGRDCTRLDLPPMSGTDRKQSGSWYTVAVDAIENVGTGISASDRARTLRLLANPASTARQFTRPGHVVPQCAREDGVLAHPGPAEVVTDLNRAAGLRRVGAFAALVSQKDPTQNACAHECRQFAKDHELNWVTADDLILYRRAVELHVRTTFTVTRGGPFGDLRTSGFRSDVTGSDYVAYRIGRPHTIDAPLVHVHREINFAPHATPVDQGLQDMFTFIAGHGGGVVIVERNINNADFFTLTSDERARKRVGRNADIAQILREVGITAPRLLASPADLHVAFGDLGIAAEVVPARELPAALTTESTTGTASTSLRSVRGVVTHGDQRGRELGFPTANLVVEEGTNSGLVDGVWAGRCELPNGVSVISAVSIGRRSTFYGRVEPRLVEAHLLDFQEDMYGLEITVYLDYWIRGQATFSSKEDLIAALNDDVRRVRVLAQPGRSPGHRFSAAPEEGDATDGIHPNRTCREESEISRAC
ncbi:3,4-dihydroxy-2-butanone-4-phosphate synthase [Rhodococcus oxybenzonivorans]|uniref:3,4-dihydroxy-2-butanone-4-phosphate synthase n=1 Tax=Rhodococcus oxybenzonivorans TaxID=1990687 RepID=UPI0029537ACC|nr:3,4-dihydroxy-2-butanone-4-phosphate synthase [Rhodococcus oxybenzonivorans]MDV7355291.1 3,4-dihydroxy-2-butanone-4-phosphate synthase [Rhodococcus oxybenzonivorans]